MRGLDYAWTHPPATAVKAAGFGFAARYLSHDTSKNLNHTEARALMGQGVDLVVVWESGAQDMLRGRGGGVADAKTAAGQAGAAGLVNPVIYFAADWDATPAQQAQINAYLDGAGSVIGPDLVGLYGGYWPCARARAGGHAAYFWGTVAWSGGNWSVHTNPHTFTPDIMQGAQVKVAGVSVDLDESHGRTHESRPGDFGQYPRPGARQPAAPPPHGLHHTTGTESARQLAHRARITVARMWFETANAQPAGWGDAQREYIDRGNWDAPMPKDMRVDLP